MRLSIAILLVLSLAACKKPGPSADYTAAREKWSALLKADLDGAYSDPAADEVLALLAKVPADSTDATFAAELKADIEKGRKDAKARKETLAATEQAVKDSMAKAAATVPAEPAKAEEKPAEAVAAAAPDAGEVEEKQPKNGMDADKFKSKFARCFEYKNDAMVGGAMGGQVWGLKDLSLCRDLHPDFKTSSVLLWDGKISVRPTADLAPKKFILVDGKLVPAEEAEKMKKPEAAPSPAPAAPATQP